MTPASKLLLHPYTCTTLGRALVIDDDRELWLETRDTFLGQEPGKYPEYIYFLVLILWNLPFPNQGLETLLSLQVSKHFLICGFSCSSRVADTPDLPSKKKTVYTLMNGK